MKLWYSRKHIGNYHNCTWYFYDCHFLVKLHSIRQLSTFVFYCRMAGDKASTFEDIVDAYLAYLQVSFVNKQLFDFVSL